MSIFDFLTLFGGLAMFLYGMRLMGDGLKESSSGTLKRAMESVTNNQFKAFREKNVYGCNVELSPFYEETPFRPDWLLNDFIRILHPELEGLAPLRYYKKL